MPSAKTKRAADTLLDELHGLQADVLLMTLRRFKDGEFTNEDGKPLPVPPALLAQVNKFLKDNGVDRAIAPGDPTDLLADEVPDFELNNVFQIGDR